MSVDQLLVACVLLALLGNLIWGRFSVATCFAAAAFVFYMLGYVDYRDLAMQVSNTGLAAVVLLVLVSVVLDKVSLLEQVTHRVIRGPFRFALFKLLVLVGMQSSILNNTAVVASMIGPLRASARENAPRFLLPMVYAVSLGGVITLIGTSTNLLISGFVMSAGMPPLEIFTPLPMGLILFVAGIAVLVVLSGIVLEPSKVSPLATAPYFIEAHVAADSPLVDRSVEENGLRRLFDLFLVEIVRGEKLIAPVRPEQTIRAGDCLVFSGDVTRIDLLTKFPGLCVHEHKGIPVNNLLEVMISPESMMINRSLREVDFRAQFDAAVVAVRRYGTQVQGQFGNLPLRAGDLLVLAIGPDFPTRNNLQRNFLPVSRPIVSKFVQPWQSLLTLGGFLAVIFGAAFGLFDLIKGLVALLVVFMSARLVRASELRSNMPWHLLLTIASALVVSLVLSKSGLAALLSSSVLNSFATPSPWIVLILVLLLTVAMTEIMTNNAAAALMFPIAFSFSQSLEVSHMPFVMAVLFGASASFMTPFGYQTNLMVMSPGAYRSRDYFRLGAPVSLVYLVTCAYLLPVFYPF